MTPEELVAAVMRAQPPHLRAHALRQVMSLSSAALILIEGRPQAAEHVYRLADHMVEQEVRS